MMKIILIFLAIVNIQANNTKIKHFPAIEYVCTDHRMNTFTTYIFKKNGTYTTDNKYISGGKWLDKGNSAELYIHGAPINDRAWSTRITRTSKGIFETHEGTRLRFKCYEK